jgi:hypothetical protein
MDGEIASEHYAGVRYRQPEIAELYDQYVCVIASVYRHTPRDHDEQAGACCARASASVTCGEHIAMEAHAYAQYLDGQRVAPRHIGVELEGAAPGTAGAEMFDMYYAWDTDSVFNAVRQGLANRARARAAAAAERPEPAGAAGQPRLAAARGGRGPLGAGRPRAAALAARGRAGPGGAAPVELLRLGRLQRRPRARGPRAARPGAGRVAGRPRRDHRVARLPMPASDRQALVEALARLGVDSPRARSNRAGAHRLALPAKVDVEGGRARSRRRARTRRRRPSRCAPSGCRGRTRSSPRATARRTSSWPSRCSRWPRPSPTRSSRGRCSSTRSAPPAGPSRWARRAPAATRCSRSRRSRWGTRTRRSGGSTTAWAASPRCRQPQRDGDARAVRAIAAGGHRPGRACRRELAAAVAGRRGRRLLGARAAPAGHRPAGPDATTTS